MVLGSLQTLTRLKPLLTGQNVEDLEHILTLLVESTSTVYSSFWYEFKRSFPTEKIAVRRHSEAWQALRTLRQIVREQRGAV